MNGFHCAAIECTDDALDDPSTLGECIPGACTLGYRDDGSPFCAPLADPCRWSRMTGESCAYATVEVSR